MAFTIHGKIGEVEAAIHWDGHSYARGWLMDLYHKYLRAHKGEFIGFLPDDGAESDYDSCAPAAYAAWMDILDEMTERAGEFPWEEREEGEVR